MWLELIEKVFKTAVKKWDYEMKMGLKHFELVDGRRLEAIEKINKSLAGASRKISGYCHPFQYGRTEEEELELRKDIYKSLTHFSDTYHTWRIYVDDEIDDDLAEIERLMADSWRSMTWAENDKFAGKHDNLTVDSRKEAAENTLKKLPEVQNRLRNKLKELTIIKE